MKSILEVPRSTPEIAETEVLVVGSNPGGLAAAISAAREGVQTMLVERYGCFGGVITLVGVNSPAWYSYGGTTDIAGIGIEIENRALEMSQGLNHPYTETLMGAVLVPDPNTVPKLLASDTPELAPPAQGCALQRRCPKFIDGVCDFETPPWQSPKDAAGHQIRCHIPIELLESESAPV